MVLLTNGCSYTYGGELEPYYNNDEQRQTLVWPHHLGQLLGAHQVINLSFGCASNHRIFRTTWDWIQTQDSKILTDCVAVIQITDFSRYEYYMPGPGRDPVDDQWVRCKVDVCTNLPTTIKVGEHDWHLDLNKKRLTTYTEEEGFYNAVMFCEALDNIFKKYKIKYYFWFGLGPILDKHVDYLTSHFPFVEMKTGYEKFEPGGHPTLKGHKDIADQIYKKLT